MTFGSFGRLEVVEQNDAWLVGKRYLSNHTLEALLAVAVQECPVFFDEIFTYEPRR